MTEKEIKHCLNKRVVFRNDRLHINGVYILTGATIRRNDNGFYYQAEVTEMRDDGKTAYICSLDDISPYTKKGE